MLFALLIPVGIAGDLVGDRQQEHDNGNWIDDVQHRTLRHKLRAAGPHLHERELTRAAYDFELNGPKALKESYKRRLGLALRAIGAFIRRVIY